MYLILLHVGENNYWCWWLLRLEGLSGEWEVKQQNTFSVSTQIKEIWLSEHGPVTEIKKKKSKIKKINTHNNKSMVLNHKNEIHIYIKKFKNLINSRDSFKIFHFWCLVLK